MKTIWRLLMTDEPDAAVVWAASHRRVAIGWGETGDLSKLSGGHQASPLDIEKEIRNRNETNPDYTGYGPTNVPNGTSSLSDFLYRMKPGDLVILSIGEGERRLVMEVVGGYEWVPSQAHSNYFHQREARIVDMDPDELWERAFPGSKPLQGQNLHRTLIQCASYIDEATLAGIGFHKDLHVGP